jgi:indolepyruvate ferredoxin oxidoreductase
VFLLGFAWQRGLVPLSAAALVRAIEINGVAVARNQQAFQWGRLAAHDRAALERAMREGSVLRDEEPIAQDLATIVARRVAFLTEYQDAGYARRYAAQVRAAEAGGEAFAIAVARNLFKLMAYKDEYEVARLYTDGAFERQVAAAFEGDYRIRYHFAPPLLARTDPKIGEPRKRAFGPWMRPLLNVLKRFKRLRGTVFDVFGYTAERRTERRLIVEYVGTVQALLAGLTDANRALAIEIASLPETIRGFGHVKHKNLLAAEARRAELLKAFHAAEKRRARAA